MDSIHYRFFIGSKEESKELMDSILADINAKREAAVKIAQEQGAETAVRGHGGKVIGLAFESEVSLPHLKYEGTVRSDTDDEKPCPWYSPRRNNKAGKELAAILKNIPAVPSFSSSAIQRLDLEHAVVGRHHSGQTCMAHAAAGFGQGQILLKIPTNPHGVEASVFGNIPPWFKEVKESEFLAAQGR
jgi:hypothetical protein